MINASVLYLGGLIGLVFGFFAGLIAFAITWNEWQRHKYEGWQLWKVSLQAGLFAFAIFFLLSLGLGYILPSIV